MIVLEYFSYWEEGITPANTRMTLGTRMFLFLNGSGPLEIYMDQSAWWEFLIFKYILQGQHGT